MTTIVITQRPPTLPRIPTNPRPIPAQGRYTSIQTLLRDELYVLHYRIDGLTIPVRSEYYTTLADAEHASRRSSTILWRLGAEHLDTIKETAE